MDGTPAPTVDRSTAIRAPLVDDHPGMLWGLERLKLEMAEPGKPRQYVLQGGGYSVRLADSSSRRSQASKLIDRRYAWRGYHTEAVAALPRKANCIMLEVSSGQRLFGTLTVRLDSEEGLLAHALYGREISALRAMGRKLCEMCKLAVDPQYGSKEVLASLFYLAYVYAHIIHQATDAIIEVNPRHAAFYQRKLGFRQIGDMRICPRVHAPAVLLRLEFDYVDAQISRHSGSRDAREKSLYAYLY